MPLADGVADLHLHTTASDGTSTVDERVQQAQDRSLEAIALTDHDCIAEGRADRVTHHGDIEVVTGVEVRADVDGTKVEILGYYVDPANDALADVLKRTRAFRRDRNQTLVENVRCESGVEVRYEDLAESTDSMLARPHVAEALVEAGAVDSIGEAFDVYLGSDGSAYVPMERLSAGTIVDAIHDAGGLASLAHPGRIRTTDVRWILVDRGIDAVEVDYPYADAPDEGYAAVGSGDAAELATEYDLLQTGGSDCHGPESGKFRIGDVRVDRDRLDAIRARADSYRSLG